MNSSFNEKSTHNIPLFIENNLNSKENRRPMHFIEGNQYLNSESLHNQLNYDKKRYENLDHCPIRLISKIRLSKLHLFNVIKNDEYNNKN